MKAKLVRQVLVQTERGLFGCYNLGDLWTSVSNTVPLPAEALGAYEDREGKAFFRYPVILLAFGVFGPCAFIFLAFSALGVRTCLWAILANVGDFLALPDCLQ